MSLPVLSLAASAAAATLTKVKKRTQIPQANTTPTAAWLRFFTNPLGKSPPVLYQTSAKLFSNTTSGLAFSACDFHGWAV